MPNAMHQAHGFKVAYTLQRCAKELVLQLAGPSCPQHGMLSLNGQIGLMAGCYKLESTCYGIG